MRGKLILLAGACTGAIAFPAYAQQAGTADTGKADEIVVTAQRTNERLQDVPIAVSAFSSEALEKQQIKNTSDLQLSLPNVTFTKTNFTSASFTIRGIGDLCVGTTCDSATAIHMNDAPLFGTRLFEGEFYDLAQIEVLRGPQGTLYGRNATSGVVNFKTAMPSMNGFAANAEAEYGNYNSVKVKGMINVPLGEKVAARVAGFYLNRDGYTKNLYDNSRIDGRDMYGLRGSLRFEPGEGTTIELMGQYFREKDSRMRAQKQMCQRDPTGVLGCLNASQQYGTTNANSTLAGVLNSRELYTIKGLPAALAFGSLYGPDSFSSAVNPADPRVVNTAYTPQYYTRETILQGLFEQELGDHYSFKLQGNYQNVAVDSSQDYNNAIQSRALIQPALNNLAFYASGSPLLGALAAPLHTYLTPVVNALMPQGPAGPLCTSAPDPSGTGVFGGHSVCSPVPLAFDRSDQYQHSWTAEATLSSKLDGKFNFLLGGIYGKFALTENSYYVDSFGLDYFSGLAGSLGAMGAGLPPSFLASPNYRNNTARLDIKTYGLFGEAYYKFSDRAKLTVGLRYNHDQKDVTARTTLYTDAAVYSNAYTYTNNSVLLPFGSTSITQAFGYANLNFNPAVIPASPHEYAMDSVRFNALTGRAVLDFQITPDNLLYVSYSRGYKSGGINPPLSGNLGVDTTFKPEFVNAFEIGSKNTFANGKVTLNLTGFYYDYKDLQLSRIVARTSVNDNINAKIYGLEAEAVLRPSREFTINANASYLHATVSGDRFLANPRDFGGGRADAVIIKDISNASNCAVGSNSGSAAAVNGFVGAVNGAMGLAAPTSFGAGSGIASTGAFGICSVLGSQIANPSAALRAAFATPTGPLPFTLYPAGIAVNVKGNKLPGAPDYKFSVGAQYAAPVGNLTVTPRVDYIYTGKSFGNIFNGAVNEVPAYSQVNAQIQLDGPDKKWYLRGWIQNVFDDSSITGLYVTDQSSGLFTNIFTLEPRRYGITAGVKF
ncbi:MAG: TonB-dependent receptor [Sphingomonadales bacterium]|nr:TonB-dependent receptor [Sphingomonadales bacterium]